MAQDPGTLAGELGLISLFDIGQLLMLNRATGVMSVLSEGRRGSLWFRDGQLVNAIDERQRDGENAAFAVFAWRRGRFEFHGAPLPGSATIDGGTEAIMLEAARRIDEAGPEAGSGGTGSETAKLVEHQSKFDLLREEFTRVTRDASPEARRAPAAEDAWLDALQSPGDRLLVRPGALARLRSAGAWRPVDGFDMPVDEAAYRAFKSRMLAAGSTARSPGSAVAPAGAAAIPAAVLIAHRGRALTIDVVTCEPECLWLAVAERASMAEVHGPVELVDALCAGSGLLLAAAPDADMAHALLAALIVRLSQTRGTTTLIVTDDPAFAPPESVGVVIVTPLAMFEASVAAARPDALAVGARGTLDGRFLTACASVPIIFGAVVAADAENALARWLLRFPAAETARARVLVESMPVAIAFADPEPAPAGTVRFTVQRVARTDRAAGRLPVA